MAYAAEKFTSFFCVTAETTSIDDSVIMHRLFLYINGPQCMQGKLILGEPTLFHASLHEMPPNSLII